jgi:hypothetical protein
MALTQFAGGITNSSSTDMLSEGKEYEDQHPEAHVPYHMRTMQETAYNLLADPRESCQIFKRMLKTRMVQLAHAEGFAEPETVQFEAITSLRKFGPGEYAKPHNHRSVDYVSVLWLSLEITDYPNYNTHQQMAGNRLHLIDPIAARSRLLNHSMLKTMSPIPGTLIIHPASVFHTSELNLGTIDTIALVTNIKVVDVVRHYVTL